MDEGSKADEASVSGAGNDVRQHADVTQQQAEIASGDISPAGTSALLDKVQREENSSLPPSSVIAEHVNSAMKTENEISAADVGKDSEAKDHSEDAKVPEGVPSSTENGEIKLSNIQESSGAASTTEERTPDSVQNIELTSQKELEAVVSTAKKATPSPTVELETTDSTTENEDKVSTTQGDQNLSANLGVEKNNTGVSKEDEQTASVDEDEMMKPPTKQEISSVTEQNPSSVCNQDPITTSHEATNTSYLVKDDQSTSSVKENSSQHAENEGEATPPISEESRAQARNIDDVELMASVLSGSCPLSKLPPLNKKVVRIFLSSTFSDTKEERNALMENVYPRVAEYCREKFGLEFQVVDMRWGVPEQASDNHSTTELCLQELQKCQDVSVGPNFVAILGNKYGYRPIPSRIGKEEFEVLREVAAECGDGWSTVEDWYCLDENVLPSVYVLQTISSKLKDYNNSQNADLRKTARAEWSRIDLVLKTTLRKVSTEAEIKGKISSKSKHKFFMSVTESEITHGLLQTSADPSTSSICIVRRIPDIEEHLSEKIAPKFIDLSDDNHVDSDATQLLAELKDNRVLQKIPQNNLTKLEIEWTASGANISLEKTKGVDVAHLPEGFTEDALQKHKKYLDDICEEFFEKIRSLIHAGGSRNQLMYDDLNTEILQHQHFARERVQVFEGREEILDTIKSYLGSKTAYPLVVHGQSGCGKTSVMAKVFEAMEDWRSSTGNGNKEIVEVIRFLGTTQMTSNVQQLIVSICAQLSAVYDKTWEEPDKFSLLIKEFWALMGNASREKPLLILIDSVDQLLPSHNAYSMRWLPESLPNFVKLIVSTIDEGFPIVEALEERFENTDTKFVQITPLGGKVGMAVITKWLEKCKRSISETQKAIVQQTLEKCSLPLYARIVFDQICRWHSFDKPSDCILEGSIKGVINKHFEFMENKLGAPLVRHALAYLTSARFGLSEVELEHVLSLDDQLLNQIYQFWKPPIRRIPPLLWTRVRNEINSYVVERSADDLLVLQWYHRQFITTAKERYLKDKAFTEYIHRNLADFFMGKWGGGKEKAFEYTKAQMTRFGLKDAASKADRKVPTQPYSFSVSDNYCSAIRYNKRKLSELPYHLLKSKQTDVLQKDVFFNYEWLYAKTKTGFIQSIVEELEFFIGADRELGRSVEMKMLLSTLQLIRPYISAHPESLPLELSGRLAKYIGFHPQLTGLIQQCDELGSLHCPLTPLYTCLETADLGLKQNVIIRASEPWQDGGCLTCNKNYDTMYLIDYSEQGESMLSSWDIDSGERLFEGPILKAKDDAVADEYFQCFLDKQESNLIALYRQRYYEGFHKMRYKGDGFVDIISVQDGSVLRTLSEFLYQYKFYNCVLYHTENWLAIRFGWKIPLLNLKEETKIQLTQPHLLSGDESKFILTKSKKSGVRYHSGDDKMVAEVRSKSASIRNFATKEDQGEFDNSDTMRGVAMTSDETQVLLADIVGNINVYEINRLSAGKLLKVKKVLSIPDTDKIKVIAEFHSEEEKQSAFQRIILSPNDQYVVGVFQGQEHWEAMLWNLGTSKFISRIADRKVLRCKHPMFSCDSSVVVIGDKCQVDIVSSTSGQIIKTYEQNQTIRDIFVSRSSPQLALLLGKEVSFLSTKIEETPKPKTKLHKKQRDLLRVQDTSILLPRETLPNSRILPEIVFEPKTSNVVESYGPLNGADLDVLNSARSQKRSPLDSWTTPDGSKVVQLHVRVQVVDATCDDLKYTPHSQDIVLRPLTTPSGSITNEQLEMPSLQGGQRILTLQSGDRIIGTGNKVKLRVGDEAKELLKIMAVPSVLAVVNHASGRPQRMHRITVYQETAVALSNKYMITKKQKSARQYLNVYDIEAGRLVTTHPVNGSCSYASINVSNTKLYTINSSCEMKIYTGPAFINQATKLELKSVSGSKIVPRLVMECRDNFDAVIVKFSNDNLQSDLMTAYIHVDCKSNKVSPPTSVKFGLEDISHDGSFGVDANLNLYDLPSGQVIRHIPYKNASINMLLQVRLIGNDQVVLVDKHDDSLHLLKLEEGRVLSLFSCNTHAPMMPSNGGLCVRQSGQIVTLNSDESTIRGIFRLNYKDSNVKINYDNELARAISLLPEIVQTKQTDPLPASSSLNSLLPLPTLNRS